MQHAVPRVACLQDASYSIGCSLPVLLMSVGASQSTFLISP
jgi:hypothetical protein